MTVYWMSRYPDGVEPGTRIAGSGSLHNLAETITDLAGAEYLGAVPEPGQTIHGLVRARKPGVPPFTRAPADFTWMRVYVRAE